VTRRPPHAVLRLLVAVLLLQTVLAPALCLGAARAAPAGLLVEICTADGLRALHPMGDPAPDGAGSHAGACLACSALPQAAELPTPALPTPAWLALAPAWGGPAMPGPTPAIRGPPGGARAPPLLLG